MGMVKRDKQVLGQIAYSIDIKFDQRMGINDAITSKGFLLKDGVRYSTVNSL